MSEENEKIGQSLPSRTIALATEYLATVVVEDAGVKNGRTALFWDLIYTISRHAKQSAVPDPDEPVGKTCAVWKRTMYAILDKDGNMITNVFEVSEDWAWIVLLHMKNKLPSGLTDKDREKIAAAKAEGYKCIKIDKDRLFPHEG